jgi:hypothetical protein
MIVITLDRGGRRCQAVSASLPPAPALACTRLVRGHVGAARSPRRGVLGSRGKGPQIRPRDPRDREPPLWGGGGGRERAGEDAQRDQGERGQDDEREASVPPGDAGRWRRRKARARSRTTPGRPLAGAAAHPRGVVFRSTRAIPSLRREMVSGSTASGSRYGPSRSSTSLMRPRKMLASATKNCGSLL